MTILLITKWRFSSYLAETSLLKWIQKFSVKHLWVSGGVLFILYSLNFIIQGFMRHDALQTRAFDLGIFAQAIWTTLHGDFLFSSLKDHICLLGDHFSPILLGVTPFYALWHDPRILLFLQPVAAASFIFPLIFLSYRKTKDPWISLVFVLIFIFYLPTRSALREDFHPEMLIEPLILWAFIALDMSRWKWFACCAIVILLAKENMCGVVFILGFYAAIFRKQRLIGAAWMIFSVCSFFAITKVIVPMMNPDGYFYQKSFESLKDIGLMWGRVMNLETLEYVMKVYAPVCFLPFFHIPTLVLTFPILFQNLLSENSSMRSFNLHYLSGLTAFLFISTIFSFSLMMNRFEWFKKHSRVLAGILLAISLMRSGPAEYYFFRNIARDTPLQAQMIRSKLRELSSEYKVLSHNDLIAQMPNRKYIYQFDYNGIPSKAVQAVTHNVDYVIVDRRIWEGPQSFEDALHDLGEQSYLPEFQENGFVMLKKSNS